MTAQSQMQPDHAADAAGNASAEPSAADDPLRQDFTCAICRRTVDMRWNMRGPGRTRSPLCRYCEGEYTRGVGKPAAGSHLDRRLCLQVSALAEALRSESARQNWPAAWRSGR